MHIGVHSGTDPFVHFATPDAQEVAENHQTADLEDARHLQADGGAGGVPVIGCASVSGELRVHRRSDAPSHADERADG